ncbi:MAG: sigma-70 family RNA polymerase sigma factor [Bacteroidaceae bacterium]
MSHEPLLTAYLKLHQNLKSMACRLLGNEEEANNAVQEAFCRLWPIRERIRDEQEASALTTRTARNLCIDQLRREKSLPIDRFKEAESSWEVETENRSAPWQIANEDRSIDQELETKQRFELVQQIIEKHLTESQRIILRMKDFEGEEIEEIATRLNMQPTNVRMILSRARKKIREQYKRLTNED